MISDLGETSKKRLVLASASPRRKELFSLTGWSSEIKTVEIDEQPGPDEAPVSLVTRLASEKGQSASRSIGDPHLLIAADTIVVDNGQILGKPADSGHAKQILQDLAGKSHRVITALTIVDSDQQTTMLDLCETVVPMRNYSTDEIDDYIATGSPFDKAGAYGIQDDDFHPVATEDMTGCYANVMGLPLCHLLRSLQKMGLQPDSDVPMACQIFTNYKCDVYAEVLSFEV
jgi:MAF protein